MQFSTLLLPIVSVAATTTLRPTDDCPLLGPTFSSNFDLAKSDAFIEAVASFPDTIAALIEAEAVSNSSTFVIDVYSTITNATLYTYTYEAVAPLLNETVVGGSLNDETIFRIGSVSKLFTVYAILAHSGDLSVFDEPVTKYIPELAGNYGKDPARHLIFENITIGALASHQAGTGMFPFKLLQQPCLNFTEPGCLLETYYNILRDDRKPAQPIGQSSLYSDNGFGILGRVLERMTNLTYGDALHEILGKSLSLNSTTTFEPTGDDLNAVVIPGDVSVTSWGSDNQFAASSGGVYSSAADLRALGIAILNSKLLPPSVTRTWMKPRAFTSSIVSGVGAPWEINRLTLPVSANSTRTRISDLYTKAGGNNGYTAVFALSPDHSLGYSVTVAGAAASVDRWPLRAAAGETFVVAAEHAARENALRNFVGTFVDPNNSTSNATLSIHDDHPAISLDSLYVDGLEVKSVTLSPLYEPQPDTPLSVQLYPTGLQTTTGTGAEQLTYRAVVNVIPTQPRSVIDGGVSLFDDSCKTWLTTAFWEDLFFDTGEFYDEFVLEVAEGQLTKVIFPVANKTLERVEL